MDNIEQFSLYTAKIFHILYESFPIPTGLNMHNIISDHLFFGESERLKKLQAKVIFSEIVENIDNDILKKNIKDESPKIKEELSKLEAEKNCESSFQKSIYNGTLDFLISEGLVRIVQQGGYILTAKSFAHLNKSFIKGKIENEDSSYIATIKKICSHTSEKAVIGIAVKVIPRLLGIS